MSAVPSSSVSSADQVAASPRVRRRRPSTEPSPPKLRPSDPLPSRAERKAKAAAQALEAAEGYWNQTRQPFACLLFLAPLLIAYELGVIWLGGPGSELFRNGADGWMRSWLYSAGLHQSFILPIVVLGLLLVWNLYGICSWRMQIETLAGMFAESVIFAFLLVVAGQLSVMACQASGIPVMTVEVAPVSTAFPTDPASLPAQSPPALQTPRAQPVGNSPAAPVRVGTLPPKIPGLSPPRPKPPQPGDPPRRPALHRLWDDLRQPVPASVPQPVAMPQPISKPPVPTPQPLGTPQPVPSQTIPAQPVPTQPQAAPGVKAAAPSGKATAPGVPPAVKQPPIPLQHAVPPAQTTAPQPAPAATFTAQRPPPAQKPPASVAPVPAQPAAHKRPAALPPAPQRANAVLPRPAVPQITAAPLGTPRQPAAQAQQTPVQQVLFPPKPVGVAPALPEISRPTTAPVPEPPAAPPAFKSAVARTVTYIGAGIYEEVLFRLLLLPASFLLFRTLRASVKASTVLAVISTSLLFALAHYVGPAGDALVPYTFCFRAAAGAYFAVLFLTRGFGVTVGAHACYDLIVGVLWS